MSGDDQIGAPGLGVLRHSSREVPDLAADRQRLQPQLGERRRLFAGCDPR
jgi:hypothetical protein